MGRTRDPGGHDRERGDNAGMHLRLTEDLMHQTPARAVGQIVEALLARARDGLDRLLADADDEALHDFRVAIRRLRSTASAWRDALPTLFSKKNRKALRKLQRMTGAARDAEVAIQWLDKQSDADPDAEAQAGHAVLRHHLTAGASDDDRGDWRTLVKAFKKVGKRMRRALEDASLEEGVFAQALAGRVEAHHAEFDALLRHAFQTGDPEESHRARVRGKRLRYLVEPVLDQTRNAEIVVKQCKHLQDVLGDMHDAHVLGLQIDSARAEEPDADKRAGLDTTRAQARSWHDRLAADWSAWMDEEHAALSVAADLLVRELEKVPGRLEIERTFLLRGLPPVPASARTREIEQGYLETEARDTEERVRRIRDGETPRYVRTVKRGTGLVREEQEEQIDAARFDALWARTAGRRIRKRRHIVDHDGMTWEIDEFLDRDLVLAEVELPSADQTVDVPSWLAPFVERDVTEEPDYANARLAQ